MACSSAIKRPETNPKNRLKVLWEGREPESAYGAELGRGAQARDQMRDVPLRKQVSQRQRAKHDARRVSRPPVSSLSRYHHQEDLDSGESLNAVQDEFEKAITARGWLLFRAIMCKFNKRRRVICVSHRASRELDGVFEPFGLQPGGSFIGAFIRLSPHIRHRKSPNHRRETNSPLSPHLSDGR